MAVEAVVPYLPNVLRSVLEAVGRRSLEVYVVSTLLTMALNYNGDQSIFSLGKHYLGKLFSTAGSDFVMSLGLTGIVAASAKIMVSRRIRLQW